MPTATSDEARTARIHVEFGPGCSPHGASPKSGPEAAEGGLIGLLFALLFGIFFTGPDFAELVLYSVVAGAVFAAPLGAIAQYVYSGGRRDFVSATRVEADRYELEVEAKSAGEATRLLESMPATR